MCPNIHKTREDLSLHLCVLLMDHCCTSPLLCSLDWLLLSPEGVRHPFGGQPDMQEAERSRLLTSLMSLTSFSHKVSVSVCLSKLDWGALPVSLSSDWSSSDGHTWQTCYRTSRLFIENMTCVFFNFIPNVKRSVQVHVSVPQVQKRPSWGLRVCLVGSASVPSEESKMLHWFKLP